MRRQHSFAVILVGKSILLREGLARILRAANFRILASVSCADDLRPSKPTTDPPLFLIVHTGNDFDAALEQIELFRNRHADARIAIVAEHYRLNELTSAFRAGANGYFVNIITCDRFIRSVELVMMGETIFPSAFLSYILDANGHQTVEAAANDQEDEPIHIATDNAAVTLLSPREKLILRCIIEGDSNKCIARKIDIAEATVKVHVKAILRKTRVQNRTQAAIWGINNGSHIQPDIGTCSPSIPDIGRRSAISFKAIAGFKQIEAPSMADIVNPEVYHSGVGRIERLVRKGRRVADTT